MSLPQFELTPAIGWLESAEGTMSTYPRDGNFRRGLFSVKDDYTYPLEVSNEAMCVYFPREAEAA